jgi:hypothetical protein
VVVTDAPGRSGTVWAYRVVRPVKSTVVVIVPAASDTDVVNGSPPTA